MEKRASIPESDAEAALAASRRKWEPLRRARLYETGTHRAVVAGDEVAMWKNDLYTVAVMEGATLGGGFPETVHLSIKRNDRRPIVCWRDVQRIKNQLVGEENEAFQVFPAESRLVDTSNQYHVFAFVDPEIRLPVGFRERCVTDVSSHGAVQEPFGENLPGDALDREAVDRMMDEYEASGGTKGLD